MNCKMPITSMSIVRHDGLACTSGLRHSSRAISDPRAHECKKVVPGLELGSQEGGNQNPTC